LNGLAPVPAYNITSLDEFGLDDFADNLRKVIADIAKVDKTGLLIRVPINQRLYFLKFQNSSRIYHTVDCTLRRLITTRKVFLDTILEQIFVLDLP